MSAKEPSPPKGSFAVAIVNPLRSRLFAKAAGALAKTDRVDCRMLAFRGESLEPDATAPPNELMGSLQELTRCRPAVLAARTSLLHQLGATRARPTALEIKRQLRATETAIANLGEKNRVPDRRAQSELRRRLVNPLRSRLFAKAAGALAKTDRVDCRMLAIRGALLRARRERKAFCCPSSSTTTVLKTIRCG